MVRKGLYNMKTSYQNMIVTVPWEKNMFFSADAQFHLRGCIKNRICSREAKWNPGKFNRDGRIQSIQICGTPAVSQEYIVALTFSRETTMVFFLRGPLKLNVYWNSPTARKMWRIIFTLKMHTVAYQTTCLKVCMTFSDNGSSNVWIVKEDICHLYTVQNRETYNFYYYPIW